VVLSPQAPSAGGWGYTTKAMGGLLDEILANYQVDATRVSLTGWSMGGYGVWWIAKAMPDRFAALVPVSGGYIYNAKQLCPVSNIPTWVFHGKKDRNVQFFQSDVVVKALKKCGGTPIFTVRAKTSPIRS
jgi:predicted peptidase